VVQEGSEANLMLNRVVSVARILNHFTYNLVFIFGASDIYGYGFVGLMICISNTTFAEVL